MSGLTMFQGAQKSRVFLTLAIVFVIMTKENAARRMDRQYHVLPNGEG